MVTEWGGRVAELVRLKFWGSQFGPRRRSRSGILTPNSILPISRGVCSHGEKVNSMVSGCIPSHVENPPHPSSTMPNSLN